MNFRSSYSIQFWGLFKLDQIICALIAACLGIFCQFGDVSANDFSQFHSVVKKHFAQWTEEDRGLLTVIRLRYLISKTEIHGEEAAALAAIHSYQKGPGNGQPLKLDDVLNITSDDPSIREDQATIGKNVLRNYSNFLAHIQSAPKKLFAVERPNSDTITQGAISDCFFIAPIGSIAHNDPDRIVRMITQRPDGTFDVEFPVSIKVSMLLSDAELALSSSAGQQGLWLNVLELSAGLALQVPEVQRLKDPARLLPGLDHIGKGGHSFFTIKLLTGHDAIVHRIGPHIDGKDPAPESKDIPDLASKYSTLIRKGLNRREVVCCSTGDYAVPPGIYDSHEYAILGLKDGLIEIWNPHGYKSNFTPKGKPGFENGYYFEGGKCLMPIQDFVKIFTRITVENNPNAVESPSPLVRPSLAVDVPNPARPDTRSNVKPVNGPKTAAGAAPASPPKPNPPNPAAATVPSVTPKPTSPKPAAGSTPPVPPKPAPPKPNPPAY